MKKVKLTSFGALAALALLASCDDGMDFGDKTGTISPDVNYDATVVGTPGSRSVSEFSDLTVDDLTLTVTNAAGESEDFSYATFPVDRGFAVGKYTMTASYGDINDEGFGKPAVFGEAEFSVSEGKASQVALTAKPSKAMVSIVYDEAALNYFTEIKSTLNSAAGSTIEYAADEARFAYLKPGEVSVDVTFIKPNGNGATLEAAKFTAEAQHRYTLTIKLGGEGAGEVSGLTVVYDETLAQEDVTIDISDEVLMIPAPVVTISGLTYDEATSSYGVLNIVEGSPLAQPLRIDINARGGVKSAVLTTSGNDINLPAEWPAEIDLATATAAQQELLKGFGFKNIGIFNNPGKLAAFDLSAVVEGFPATQEDADPVTFGLKVTDKNGKVSSMEPITFQVKVDRLFIELEGIEGYAYAGEETADVLVTYNGTLDLKQALDISYLASSGKMLPTEIVSVEPYSRAAALYKVSVKIPADAQLPITLQAKAGDITTGEVHIPMATAPVVSFVENDVFATSAWVKISSDDYDVATKSVSIEVKEGNGSYTKVAGAQSGDEFHITGGLKAGTTYSVRAKIGALVSEPVNMTTETAAQIPGSDMESFDAKSETMGTFGFTHTWSWNEPKAPWYSNNNLTFSKKSGQAKRSANHGVSLDEDGDSRVANIRTVGSSPRTTKGDAETIYRGELFLSDDGSNYGYGFTSRPSEVQFRYKYAPYGSDNDYALAEVTLYNSANESIASGSLVLDPTSSYVVKTIKLSYDRSKGKATKIHVKFRSSNTDNFGCQSLTMGQTGEVFTGAQLYVDDVTLVY